MSITKKSIIWTALSPLVITSESGEKSFDRPRQELINLCYDALIANGVDKHDIKPKLIPSYLQMARMEMLKGESAYKHHKGVKKTTDAEVAEPIVIIPDGSQWQAVRDDVTEYFKNRQAATAFVGKNGGNDEWNVTKLAS